MPYLLAFVGLIIGAAAYWLLVRRRVFGRISGVELARALTASNQVALDRIRNAPRRRADTVAAIDDRPGAELIGDRRSGTDRRGPREIWRGRGRRTGGDRRQGERSRDG
jgi:hypothetical protein